LECLPKVVVSEAREEEPQERGLERIDGDSGFCDQLDIDELFPVRAPRA
jgi:hypothetical protein